MYWFEKPKNVTTDEFKTKWLNELFENSEDSDSVYRAKIDWASEKLPIEVKDLFESNNDAETRYTDESIKNITEEERECLEEVWNEKTFDYLKANGTKM